MKGETENHSTDLFNNLGVVTLVNITKIDEITWREHVEWMESHKAKI